VRRWWALVHFDGPRGMVGCPSISLAPALPMPHKHNAARRHHIPKMSLKVQNWPGYEAGLRQRGSLTLWIEDGALEDWQTCGQGGQARYTDAAIQTSLMLRTAFKLPLRQAEGL
jgi:Transposase DDE domain